MAAAQKIKLDHEPEYQFCPLCATPLDARHAFGAVRRYCPACGWMHFKDPKVAAALLVRQAEKVLLVKRNHPPAEGLWSLPAGFVDAGEDPAKAAERECLEETGLVARAVRLLDVIAGREHPRGADMLIVYAGEIIGGGLQAGDDAGAADFFATDNLPPLAFHTTKHALKTLDSQGRD